MKCYYCGASITEETAIRFVPKQPAGPFHSEWCCIDCDKIRWPKETETR